MGAQGRWIDRRSSSASLAPPPAPTASSFAMPEVTFSVGMTCEGCSGAVTKILKKMDGIEDVECDIEKKEVKVTYVGDKVEPKGMHEKLEKWATAAGKELGPVPEPA